MLRTIKRAMDVVGLWWASSSSRPVIHVAAIHVRWCDGAPVLFRQERVGLHGRLIAIIKYRTRWPMPRRAMGRSSGNPTLAPSSSPTIRGTPDRVASCGKAGIDEVPQLWNVLRGDMSLVGPRPAPAREVERYEVWHRRRLSTRHGISGLWQVSTRRDEDFDGRALLDLRYIDQWSLLFDLGIPLRSIPAVLGRTGVVRHDSGRLRVNVEPVRKGDC
jgi:lipopolysaccharide/colanic/teichoic acid biosynthesis glycosyltransferase